MQNMPMSDVKVNNFVKKIRSHVWIIFIKVLFSERPHKVVVQPKDRCISIYISINSQTSHLCKLRELFRM